MEEILHELGIVYEIVKTVENFVKENKLSKVEKIVLQVGELSTVVPKYLHECYPAAVHETDLESTELEIEILPGNAMCQKCQNVYNLVKSKGKCPKCKSKKYEILSGKEFLIKEIIAC